MVDGGTVAAILGGGGAGVAAVTGISTWLVARRTGSGRINTSEAAQLWHASESLRTTLTTQLGEARHEIADLIKKNETLLAEIATLRADVATLRAEKGKERAEAEAWWRAQIDELRADAARQHRQEMAAIRRTKGES